MSKAPECAAQPCWSLDGDTLQGTWNSINNRTCFSFVYTTLLSDWPTTAPVKLHLWHYMITQRLCGPPDPPRNQTPPPLPPHKTMSCFLSAQIWFLMSLWFLFWSDALIIQYRSGSAFPFFFWSQFYELPPFCNYYSKTWIIQKSRCVWPLTADLPGTGSEQASSGSSAMAPSSDWIPAFEGLQSHSKSPWQKGAQSGTHQRSWGDTSLNLKLHL